MVVAAHPSAVVPVLLRWSRCALLLAGCIAASANTSARAQPKELAPPSEGVALGGELGYFTDRQANSSVHVTSLRVFGQYAFDAQWALYADFGVVTLRSSADRGESDTVWRPGNPTLIGLRRGRLGAVDYTLGAGASAPLAVIDADVAGRSHHAAYNWVQGMSGLADVWLWAPSRGAVLALARATLELDPHLRVAAELSPALMIPARDAFVRQEAVQLLVPLRADGWLSLGPVSPGLRAQVVLMTVGSDAVQFALAPWLRVAFGSAFVELRYTQSLGEPLAGERGPGSWGLHLSAGGNL